MITKKTILNYSKKYKYHIASGFVFFVIVLIVILATRKNKVAKTAKKFVGQEEIGSNAGFKDKNFETEMKKAGWYSGAEWCAFFTRLVWLKALTGQKRQIAEKLLSGSSQQTFVNFQNDKSGLFKVAPRPKIGSIVVWQSQETPAKGHVGIVKNVSGDSFTTIEGNANVNQHPGIVAEKTYSIEKELNRQIGLKLRGFINIA